MLALILLFFIGYSFFNLAIEHEKNKWVYTILGIVSYYIGTMIGGVVLVIGLLLFDADVDSVDNMSDAVLGLLALPFGLLTCWLVYKYLKKQWESKIVLGNDILDDEFLS